MRTKPIRVGTRESSLALWQANEVVKRLRQANCTTDIIKVMSSGDSERSKPLQAFDQRGIFTRALDQALLDDAADIAVHSLKDYPTTPEAGVVIAAHLPREKPFDVFVPGRDTFDMDDPDTETTIATGSIRRRAQWLWRFPAHRMIGLRGNVPTRLGRIRENEACGGGILAFAGLARLGLFASGMRVLEWMVPAPAQGIIAVACRASDTRMKKLLQTISDGSAMQAAHIERSFLRTLEGGCSAPIGALAAPVKDGWQFKGRLASPDGFSRVDIQELIAGDDWTGAGERLARQCLQRGGAEIMKGMPNA